MAPATSGSPAGWWRSGAALAEAQAAAPATSGSPAGWWREFAFTDRVPPNAPATSGSPAGWWRLNSDYHGGEIVFPGNVRIAGWLVADRAHARGRLVPRPGNVRIAGWLVAAPSGATNPRLPAPPATSGSPAGRPSPPSSVTQAVPGNVRIAGRLVTYVCPAGVTRRAGAKRGRRVAP